MVSSFKWKHQGKAPTGPSKWAVLPHPACADRAQTIVFQPPWLLLKKIDRLLRRAKGCLTTWLLLAKQDIHPSRTHEPEYRRSVYLLNFSATLELPDSERKTVYPKPQTGLHGREWKAVQGSCTLPRGHQTKGTRTAVSHP